MLVTINHKKDEPGAVWEKMPVPDALSERIALMKSLIGTQTIITVTNDKMTCYFCGTDDIRMAKHKQMADKGLTRICQTLKDAHEQLELAPLHFLYALQAFSSEADAKIIFPDKPIIYEKGWDHLKPKENE